MSRLTLAAGALLLVLAGCSWRTVKHEIRDVDGHKAYCSWTENEISGNQSDPQCAVLP